MASEAVQFFRFLDLPAEIRNRIYKIILCSFDSPPPSRALVKGMVRIQNGRVQYPTGICSATHSIETTILCASKEIHQEAYDVMVKTNQFIHVETVDVSMSQLLVPSQVPIVTMDRQHAAQFQGYVLSMHMSTTPTRLGLYFNFMVLGRDWDAFCAMIADAGTYIPGFSTKVKTILSLDPCPATVSDYKACITDFFSTKTQEHILKPFRTHIRGFPNVEIRGTVSLELADAVIEDVKKSRWTDPRKILQDLQEAKELGTQFYEEDKITEASEKWTSAASDVRMMRCSASWQSLVAQGGSHFINKLAELYFLVLLNSAQFSLKVMNAASANHLTVMTMGDVVTSNIEEAFILPNDSAKDGGTWKPNNAQMAKLYFTQAQCWRLMEEEGSLGDAVRWIDMASEAAPGDAMIVREKQAISEWETRVDDELAHDEDYQEWVSQLL